MNINRIEVLILNHKQQAVEKFGQIAQQFATIKKAPVVI